MKPYYLWVVLDSYGSPFVGMEQTTRRGAIHMACSFMGNTWSRLYRAGYRCTRVRVTQGGAP